MVLLPLAAYGFFLWRHASHAFGGSDSAGYANAARRLATGRLVDRPRCLDLLGLPNSLAPICTPLGFLPGPRPGTTAPLYPVGYPAQVVAAARIFGWQRGPFLINPAAATLCILMLYLTGRELSLSPLWSGAAALALAAWPPFVLQALEPLSDTTATLWSLASILFALRARRDAAWAFASGGALGLAVLVRPADALAAVPLLLALPLTVPVLSRFALGLLPLAGLGAVYNATCYGSPLESGYTRSGYLGVFAFSNFGPRFLFFAGQLTKTLSPLVPLAAVSIAAIREVPGRTRALLLSWFGVFFGFYCFHGPYAAFGFLRYLLPGIPGLLLAAALAGQSLAIRAKGRFLPVAALAAPLLLVLGLEARVLADQQVLGIAHYEEVYPNASRFAARTLPEKSVVIAAYATGALEYYTDLCFARWDAVTPDSFVRLRPAVESRGYRFFALLFPDEEKELTAQAPGRWTKIGVIREVGLWRLEP